MRGVMNCLRSTKVSSVGAADMIASLLCAAELIIKFLDEKQKTKETNKFSENVNKLRSTTEMG